MESHGSNRDSTELRICAAFEQHPDSTIGPDDERVIPAVALGDLVAKLNADGVPVFTDDELEMFNAFIQNHPEIHITPNVLLSFIAAKSQVAAVESPSDDTIQMPLPRRNDGTDGQGSSDEARPQDLNSSPTHRRSPSSDEGFSRASSRGPPTTPKTPFDSDRRQRATAAPSSWSVKKLPPPARRKSDAGSRSDSDYGGPFQRSTSRQGSRSRAPSVPASPNVSNTSLPSVFSPEQSPGPGSRPASRQESRSSVSLRQHHSAGPHSGPRYFHGPGQHDNGYSSPEEDNAVLYNRRRSLQQDEPYIRQGLNSVPMLRSAGYDGSRGYDSDSDDERDSVVGLVSGRDASASDASEGTYERLEALMKLNKDLLKKKEEAENALHRKSTEWEMEQLRLETQLEQTKAELSSTKKEEKELRGKERQNNNQIAALEQELIKITKQLESARSTYTSLQKQYQEQCAASERYRVELRNKEDTLRSLADSASLHEIESSKLMAERASLEDRCHVLERELEEAQNVYGQFEEQKQENLYLKETIDRMRHDLDDMRISMSSSVMSGSNSIHGSVSKSLGAELKGHLDQWNESQMIANAEQEDEDEVQSQITLGNEVLSLDGDDTEGEEEDVIQTIITKRKRKVASRAQIEQYKHREFEEVKEYADMGIQYDPTEFAVSRGVQIDLRQFRSETGTQHEVRDFVVERTAQTDPEVKPMKAELSVQTDVEEELAVEAKEPEKVTVEMEIQTEPVPEDEEEEERETERSPSPTVLELESLASSSSTVVPSTPRPLPTKSLPVDLGLDDQDASSSTSMDQPPAYHDHNWAVVSDVLRKWHAGAKIPVPADGGLEGGIVSEELVEDWKNITEELGHSCLVIDKIIANSRVAATGSASNRRSAHTAASASDGATKGKRRSRFYNIYNTYVIGDDPTPPKTSPYPLAGYLTQAALVVGASAFLLFALTPYVAPHYEIPGGVTYYDRAAWNSFNTMQVAGEGFSSDGSDAVWSFLGRVGGGAARMARGWPT